MQISLSDVEYLAELSRLEFSDEEAAKMQKDLSSIIDYVNKLNDIKTEDIAAKEHILNLSNVLRQDIVMQSLSNEEALKNAYDSEENYFKVPQLMEDE
ncbi:MAG: Asp-tRNA(Asn)/Glu-tRNA(Gln) amidotransferase subunit GatC [Eubacteriaceae bacterium]|nr:Asp-tRNA(Asn)/Glu-tRNA(Gln) amidotransferase subunit GatC [Eubacteriaceae bacterium]